jgi:hypothetical protein
MMLAASASPSAIVAAAEVGLLLEISFSAQNCFLVLPISIGDLFVYLRKSVIQQFLVQFHG